MSTKIQQLFASDVQEKFSEMLADPPQRTAGSPWSLRARIPWQFQKIRPRVAIGIPRRRLVPRPLLLLFLLRRRLRSVVHRRRRAEIRVRLGRARGRGGGREHAELDDLVLLQRRRDLLPRDGRDAHGAQLVAHGDEHGERDARGVDAAERGVGVDGDPDGFLGARGRK